jgi:hypothetical protein
MASSKRTGLNRRPGRRLLLLCCCCCLCVWECIKKFLQRRKTLVIQENAYSGVFSLFGFMADRSLFCLF